VPRLGFGEERVHPHPTLPDGLSVRLGTVIGSQPVEVLFVETAPEPTLLGVAGAPLPDWAGTADGHLALYLMTRSL
jgi:hypothetical protein